MMEEELPGHSWQRADTGLSNRQGRVNTRRTNGHENGHQRSDTAQAEVGSARMKRLFLLDQTTSAWPCWIRTKRGKANFKTGDLSHSATLPALIQIERRSRARTL